jgi:hypothetical protein
MIRRNSLTVAGAAPELFLDEMSRTHRLPVSSLGWIPLGHLKQIGETIETSKRCQERKIKWRQLVEIQLVVFACKACDESHSIHMQENHAAS